MFREMRRHNQAVAPIKCKEILTKAHRAVLSVLGDEGYPYGVPVNFFYDEADHTIYIHSAKEGHKLDAIRHCDKVCFTTWDEGFRKEGDWAWFVTSVIVMGKAELINDPDLTAAKVRQLGRKYYPSFEEVEEQIHSAINQVQLIAIRIEHMTGKQVHEK